MFDQQKTQRYQNETQGSMPDSAQFNSYRNVLENTINDIPAPQMANEEQDFLARQAADFQAKQAASRIVVETSMEKEQTEFNSHDEDHHVQENSYVDPVKFP